LRDDLKVIKASQFQENYTKELERPKELLKIAETAQEKEQSPKLDVDGTTYYETKFFMNDQMIDEFLDEASDEVDHEGKTKS
jgi:hypothetical protein